MMKMLHKEVVDIIDLLTASQEEVYDYIVDMIPYKHMSDSYIIYDADDTPKPLLCVHLDTINTMSNHKLHSTDIEFEEAIDLLSLSADTKARCLGADDRAGVYIALELIKHMVHTKDFKYAIGFFKDEEVGGVGSSDYRIDYPTDNYTCYIGLDRRTTITGQPEVATYGYDNQYLIRVFTKLGYKEVMGSFTDASNIAGHNACINLSVGYDKEHTKLETLDLVSMNYTLDVLKEIPRLTEEYLSEDTPYYPDYDDDYDWYYDEYPDTKIAALKDENEILREYIVSMGQDPDKLIAEYKHYW